MMALDQPKKSLSELRSAFQKAVKKLENIPDSELSASGQPYTQECADAVVAFAEWFGAQTPDDVALMGNAQRNLAELAGLSGIIDWVAHHVSVDFAKEIERDVDVLFAEGESFDKRVAAALTLENSPKQIVLARKPLSDEAHQDIENAIARVAGLAYGLGTRLARVGVWEKKGGTKGERRPSAEGMAWETADKKIRDYLTRHGKDHRVTVGELVKEIGCSAGTVAKCPAWQTYMKGRKANRQPGAVGMTDKMLNRTDTGTEDADRDDDIDKSSHGSTPKDELARLIREQQAEQRTDEAKRFTPRRKP